MSQWVSVLPNASAGLVDEFGDGLVADTVAQDFELPAALALLPQSQWFVAQWGQPVAVSPANYTTDNPASADPLYGDALYAWSTPGATSSIAIYQNTAALGGGDVYDLTDGNTDQPASAGGTDEADMFLSSPSTADANLSHPVTVSLNAKITQSLIQFSTPALSAEYATSGTVFGTFDIGLTVNFNGADGLPAYSGYVQIVPWTSDSTALANYTNGPISPGDSTAQFISSALLPGDPSLALLPADAGAAPDSLSYTINQYVYNTLVEAFAEFPAAEQSVLLNLANWTLGGVYIGPATNDAQTASPAASATQTAAAATTVVATESVGIQISDIAVTTDTGSSFTPTAPAASAAPSASATPTVTPAPAAAVAATQTAAPAATVAVSQPDTNPQIAYVDHTIGAGGTADGSVYAGPVAGIQDRYIYSGADTVSLTATAGENWEFGGGSGFTTLTAISGDNIFVASTGGSSMTGGTGQDVFDIPDANATGIATTNTIVNFHPGDEISLSGLAGPGWSYAWYAGSSANGASGLTLLATSSTTPGLHELVTLAGLSMADLASLTIAPDASGSNALLITRGNPRLQSDDLVTGVSSALTGNATSDIAGIDAEYIYSGPDSVALTAPAGSNWEFGGGSAFSQLTASSGNNVFLASTGGSDMQGGSGSDVFMIPDANIAGASVWDNIAFFHSGDTLSLAGLAGQGWSYDWTDSYGSAASPALTLQATSTTTPGLTALVTLTGLTMGSLSSLAITHGSGADANTLTVSYS